MLSIEIRCVHSALQDKRVKFPHTLLTTKVLAMNNSLETLGKTSQLERIDISLIRTDGGTQPRTGLNPATVKEYVEGMTMGATFPPVTGFYDGKTYWLADGFHRLEAARKIQASEILIDVRQGTKRDAILYAVSANARHGLRRSNEDKRRAVEILLNDREWSQWSNRELARHCEVSLDLVNRLRRKMNPTERIVQSKNCTNGSPSGQTPQLKRKAADGRIINVANIGKTLTNLSDDKSLSNSQADHPALEPAKAVKKKAPTTATVHPGEEQLPGKESNALAEFEVGSFVQVTDRDSPHFLESCEIVSIDSVRVNIFTSQGENFFLKKDLSPSAPPEKFQIYGRPKEASELTSELQPEGSEHLRVLRIEQENLSQIQEAVQTLEITSTGLRVEIECCPLPLITLLQQMQENPAFAKEVLQQAKLLAEAPRANASECD